MDNQTVNIHVKEWSNNPSLKELQRDFEEAKSYQKSHMIHVQNWRDLYSGVYTQKTKPNRSSIQPKLVRKQAEWRAASLSEPFLSNEDLFEVMPRTWEDRERSNKSRILLNYQFNNNISRVSFIDEFIRTCVEDGTVILKTGWKYESSFKKQKLPVYDIYEVTGEHPEDESYAMLIQELLEMRSSNPSDFLVKVPPELREATNYFVENGILARFEQVSEEETDVEIVYKNHPTVEVIPIDNVYFDPSCEGDLSRASFVVHQFESSMAALKADGRYKNLSKVNVDESPDRINTPDFSYYGDQNFNFKDKARKKLLVTEYWGYWDVNGDNKLVPIVCAWIGNVMVRLEENPFPDKKIPFVVAPYLPIRKSIYGEPDAALLEDNQKIIGAVTRAVIDILARNAAGQKGFAKGALSELDKRKYMKGDDFEYNPLGMTPDQAIWNGSITEIPVTAFNMLSLQNAEAESLSGVKAFSSGLSEASLGKVATSVRGVLDAASKRESSILRRLAKALEEVGKKFISMDSEFLSDEEIIRITNENFETIYRDEIAGEYDLKLSITTAEESAARAQELSFMLQTIGNSLDFEMVKILLAEYSRLNKMPDLAKQIETYVPQPDPIAQEKLMLENEELKAKIQQIYADIQKAQVEANLDMSKINTEVAKADKLASEKDLNNLNFVEQESGVKQARDIEKQGAQARANTEYAIVQSALKRQENTEKSLLEGYLQNNGVGF